MKRLISASTISSTLLLLIASVDASAAVKCQPLVKEMKAQDKVVSDFSYSVIKEEKKLQRILNDISDKNNQLAVLQSEISFEQDQIQLKKSDKHSLVSSIQSLEDQKQIQLSAISSMLNQMHQLSYEMENLPARSTALRNLLREKKRTEKKLELKQAEVQSIQDQMSPVLQSINTIEASIMSSLQNIEQIKQEKMALKNQQPTLKNLKQRKADALMVLQNQQSIQDHNLMLLAEVTEKVDVCKTYKVKYPLSLKIAKEIYQVGCDSYSSQNFQDFYKQQAEVETIDKICGSNL